MVLLEEYYELNENENVSKWWKISQIFFYISAGILGIWSGFSMALARQVFDDKCYLSAKIVLLDNDIPSEGSQLNFDSTNSVWGSDSLCEYCQYSMISSFIFAVIWGTFFLMCGKGGKSISGLPQPWRIVLPSLIFNLIYLIIVFVASILVQDGTDSFCKELDENGNPPYRDCKGIEKLVLNNTDFALRMLNTVEKTSWATSAAWLFAFLLPLLRIVFVTDFRLIKVCVYKIDEGVHNKQEEVVNVTDYEEPSKKIMMDEATEIDEDFHKIVDESLGKTDASPAKIKKKKHVKIKKKGFDEFPIMEKKGSTGEIFYIKADIEKEEADQDEEDEEIIEPRVQTLDEITSGSVVKRVNRPKL